MGLRVGDGDETVSRGAYPRGRSPRRVHGTPREATLASQVKRTVVERRSQAGLQSVVSGAVARSRAGGRLGWRAGGLSCHTERPHATLPAIRRGGPRRMGACVNVGRYETRVCVYVCVEY